MKTIKVLPVLLAFVVSSCCAVRVASDYDKSVDFSAYKTYGFYKTGIDKAEISDLDKKRILRSIETSLAAKGYTKSETPDLLVNIFTKARTQVDVNQFNAGWGYGWGWGWNPYMWGGGYNTSVNTYTEGTLFIDLIDAKKKELLWQGEGIGTLTKDVDKKDERANEFVSAILQNFPPGAPKK
ncbi:DUF4136 domain-containing protein [Flavobacterium silvaticum]|uniref:DUF4136 domain-containing protein n=1 Tax=Flavobacterium silvaticum TaxID=1852020 RepID=A0A972FQQ0_9FLAO|nr:DUF4136 domain-containing protein [Flavobacterium silvaticum]NMH26723.1 DUF4136 domain-containing protein [Flavobacterium silvaticum]